MQSASVSPSRPQATRTAPTTPAINSSATLRTTFTRRLFAERARPQRRSVTFRLSPTARVSWQSRCFGVLAGLLLPDPLLSFETADAGRAENPAPRSNPYRVHSGALHRTPVVQPEAGLTAALVAPASAPGVRRRGARPDSVRVRPRCRCKAVCFDQLPAALRHGLHQEVDGSDRRIALAHQILYRRALPRATGNDIGGVSWHRQ